MTEKLLSVTELLHNEKTVALTSIVHSLGTLQYRHEELINELIGAILKKKTPSEEKLEKTDDVAQCVSPSQLSSLLLSCAHLDYLPQVLEGKLSEVVKQIKDSPEVDSRLWLNTVWALVILGKADADTVASVLKSSFVESLKGI